MQHTGETLEKDQELLRVCFTGIDEVLKRLGEVKNAHYYSRVTEDLSADLFGELQKCEQDIGEKT